MDIEKAKKKANVLWRAWWISYIICLLALKIYDVTITFETGDSPIALFNPMHIITLAITILFFLPFILVVNHYARIAGMKQITIGAKIISIIIMIWTVFNIIAVINYFINL